MSVVLQVNVAVPEQSTARGVGLTGINKQPVDGPVRVRPPGPKRPGALSGVAGDQVFDLPNHGGDDQAVYAYAREDYDWWAGELGRSLAGGLFGENLTTAGLDVNGAMVGEIWQIGEQVLLQTTFGRIPCATFQAKMGEPQWIKRFSAGNRPGAYLRILAEGDVQAGDRVQIVDRPARSLTIAESFHAYLHEPQALKPLLEVESVEPDLRRRMLARISPAPRGRAT
jgi:MOSC domain-containing protein YiiM